VIDMLADPAAGGGTRHVADCLAAYLKRPDADVNRLIEYADRIGNGVVFKRLGFLTEKLSGPRELISACAVRLTEGYSKLEPAASSRRINRRWRLWIPESWKQPLRTQ
jgi:predicted transcriptional regulator of viral defense system